MASCGWAPKPRSASPIPTKFKCVTGTTRAADESPLRSMFTVLQLVAASVDADAQIAAGSAIGGVSPAARFASTESHSAASSNESRQARSCSACS
jgi:hypothetical protein